ncbi:hypothetical protein [Flammeovirga aprica]|uniref:Uncharacterized protein n=1 Tax=Flammeovirga aprica JL-4 TaxID=694437 RepID=A0A7X9XCS6_9BACT|nr:hypothetical protein [Flammeovirga aprica]NME72146.1 hypothetical protein [Flammeovirga aprica JL-4]
MITFTEYIDLLNKDKGKPVFFHQLAEMGNVGNWSKIDAKKKDNFYKKIVNLNKKVKEYFKLEVEEVLWTLDTIEEHNSSRIIKETSQVLRGKDKGKYRVGYILKVNQPHIEIFNDMLNLRVLHAQLHEKTRLTYDPSFYLDYLDFESNQNGIPYTNENNWLDWFDELMIYISKNDILALTYESRNRSHKTIRILPLKIRENLYGKFYLFGVRVEEDDQLPLNVNFENTVIIKISSIVSLTKTLNSKLKNELEKIKNLKSDMEEVMQSFFGVIVPEYNYRSADKIPEIKLKVSSFQYNYFKNYKSIVHAEQTEDGCYWMVTFKTIPTFEFIRFVIVLSDVWNYDHSYNGKSLAKETAIEVVGNDKHAMWIKNYLAQTYRRALYKYEQNPVIKAELKREIEEWNNTTYPFVKG